MRVNRSLGSPAGLRGICAGLVHELGARWWRNWNQQASNSAHTEACGYQFHGTFPGVQDGDYVDYYDRYTFPVDVNGRTGTAVVDTGGDYQVSDR
jgi:hypothetical protein